MLDSLMANVAMTATSRTFACAAAMRTTASKVLVHVGPEPARSSRSTSLPKSPTIEAKFFGQGRLMGNGLTVAA